MTYESIGKLHGLPQSRDRRIFDIRDGGSFCRRSSHNGAIYGDRLALRFNQEVVPKVVGRTISKPPVEISRTLQIDSRPRRQVAGTHCARKSAIC